MMGTTVAEAQKRVRQAALDLIHAKKDLVIARKQESCKHERVDKPGSIFGETCLDCNLYLNNGF